MAVCQFNSFSRAGNYLFMDQSTVSKKINQLEQFFGQQFFSRSTHGVNLTPVGQQFYQKAQRLLSDFDELQRPTTIDLSAIRVGMLDNISAYHFAPKIVKIISQLNKLVIAIKGRELIDQFNDGQLDAIVINHESAGHVTGDFQEKVLFSEPFGVLTSKKISSSSLELADLANDQILIAPSYCPVSRKLKKALPASVTISRVAYTNTLLEMVANSNFATILPWPMVQTLAKNDHRFMASRLIDMPARKVSLISREINVTNLLAKVLC